MNPLHVLAFEEAEGFGGAFVDLAHISLALRQRGVRVSIARSYDDPCWAPLQAAGCTLMRHDRPNIADRVRRAFEHTAVGRRRLDRLARMGIYGAEQALVMLPLGLHYGQWARRQHVTHVFCNNGFTHNTAALVAARVSGARVLSYQQGESDGSGAHARLLPSVDVMYAVSEYTRHIELRLGADPARTHVLYPGVDLPPASDAAPRPDDGRVSVGMVGMLTPWKGHLAFIDAMARVIAQRPNVDGLIFGRTLDTARAYPAAVQARIDGHGLGGRVRVISDRSRPDQIYPHLDVSVHCSLQPEPFGRVVIEPMAFGRPVIAANRGGPLETVTPHVGLLVPPEDTAAFAAAIDSLVADRERRLVMGAAARRRVEENFTYPAVLRPLLDTLGL